MTQPRRVFLAHAREDKERVRALYKQIKERGFSPWLDEEDLIPGQIWEIEIQKAIHEAGAFIACLSQLSVQKQGYVQTEFRLALTTYGEKPAGAIYFIPVRLDECEIPDLQIPNRGLSIRDFHWLDLWQEGGFDQLIRALEKGLGTTGQATGELRKGPLTPTPRPRERALYKLDEHLAKYPHSSEARLLKDQMVSAMELAERHEAKPELARELPDFAIFRDIDEPWCPEMVALPAGEFLMGSLEDEEDRKQNEGPQHRVTIGYRFGIGRYVVTFDEFDYFCAATNRTQPFDNNWGRGRRPVINVPWRGAVAYCVWLANETGKPYRLPSEAEWEYACRAGTTRRFSCGDQISSRQANCYASIRTLRMFFSLDLGQTKEVGSYPSNPWGLYDMHGNAWEWVEDIWHADYKGAPTDGSAWTDGEGANSSSSRVNRGGSWSHYPSNARSAHRGCSSLDGGSNVGFRVARTFN